MDLGPIDQAINNSSLYIMLVVGLLVKMLGVQMGEMSKMFSLRSVHRSYKWEVLLERNLVVKG
jgi:hypothetical protein